MIAAVKLPQALALLKCKYLIFGGCRKLSHYRPLRTGLEPGPGPRGELYFSVSSLGAVHSQHACQLTSGLQPPHKQDHSRPLQQLLISLKHFPVFFSLASGLSICYSHHSAPLLFFFPPFRCRYFTPFSLKCHTSSLLSFPLFSSPSPAHHLWPPVSHL